MILHVVGCPLCVQETLEQTEALLKRHEAFEKAAATQEERFNSLQQLTTVRKDILLF